MLRRLALVLMLFAGLALVPQARAAQPCCEHGACDQAMPGCMFICALCASPAAMPSPERLMPAAACTQRQPAAAPLAFDDWIEGIWNPPG